MGDSYIFPFSVSSRGTKEYSRFHFFLGGWHSEVDYISTSFFRSWQRRRVIKGNWILFLLFPGDDGFSNHLPIAHSCPRPHFLLLSISCISSFIPRSSSLSPFCLLLSHAIYLLPPTHPPFISLPPPPLVTPSYMPVSLPSSLFLPITSCSH